MLSRLKALLPLSAIALFALSADAKNTMVRLDTPVGSMTFELYSDAKPVTVANFLKYIASGRFAHSFAHRLPQGFVLQGGAFTYSDGDGTQEIPSYDPIVNEAGPFPEYSNVEGTLAMAKIDGDPDSATSSWFLNLQNNDTGLAEDGNLDLQNGGFTVFGALVSGQDVLQKFKDFVNYTTGDSVNVIIDLSQGNSNSPFTQVPVTKVLNNSFDTDDLIYTTWTVLSDPVAPGVETKPKVKGKKGRVTLKGTATAGTTKVEVKIGKKGFKPAKGSPSQWKFVAKGLKPGKYKCQIRATGAGGTTALQSVKVIVKN